MKYIRSTTLGCKDTWPETNYTFEENGKFSGIWGFSQIPRYLRILKINWKFPKYLGVWEISYCWKIEKVSGYLENISNAWVFGIFPTCLGFWKFPKCLGFLGNSLDSPNSCWNMMVVLFVWIWCLGIWKINQMPDFWEIL